MAISSYAYSSVMLSDSEYHETPRKAQCLRRQSLFWGFYWISFLSFFFSVVVIVVILNQDSTTPSVNNAPIECQTPAVRQEWRALSKAEQIEYLEAVNCLRTLDSRIGMNHSRYDDFPFIHSRIGNYSHKTTDFLVWHRYFLQIYENTLKNDCGYKGHLTYWDWSLDSANIEESPLFDAYYGFGSNGNSTASSSVAFGHCVTDGPFAMLQALYFGAEAKRHCLSRGFISKEEARSKSHLYNSEAIHGYLKEPDFDSFYRMLEFGAHNAIPSTIRGDFFMVTAPYDPLFFLHHAQLDRIWFTWQSRDPTTRVLQLSGKDSNNATELMMLEKLLDVGGLDKQISVAQTLNTRAGVFCYAY